MYVRVVNFFLKKKEILNFLLSNKKLLNGHGKYIEVASGDKLMSVF